MPVVVDTGDALTSEGSATVDGVTLSVVSNSTQGRMEFTVTGGAEGEPLYINRRDSAGSALVRETRAGTILWVAGTPTTAPLVVDYEARQGLQTDYTLTDLEGSPLVTVRVVIPTWGTWLKNPGKPHQNLRCLWAADQSYTRAARQSVLPIRGAQFPIVHSDARTAPTGEVRLLTETAEQARSMTTLVKDGSVLMVDVPLEFGVPVRYVSVGDVTGSRLSSRTVYGDDRFWALQVTEVAAPVGLPAGQSFTYEGLAASADSYIGLAASFATYDLMSVGESA